MCSALSAWTSATWAWRVHVMSLWTGWLLRRVHVVTRLLLGVGVGVGIKRIWTDQVSRSVAKETGPVVLSRKSSVIAGSVVRSA